MLSRKTKTLLAVIALLSLAAAAFCGWWGSTLPLERVIAAVPAGERIYGIGQGETAYRFFQTDETGAVLPSSAGTSGTEAPTGSTTA